MSTNIIKKNSRGLRTELKVYDDFIVDKEELDKVIEAFANIPEKHIVSYDSLLYVSSAWKEGEEQMEVLANTEYQDVYRIVDGVLLIVKDFVDDIYVHTDVDYPIEKIERHKTPHGYAIVVPHGFDTRELMEKWKDYDITLKKDELLFLDIIVKDGEMN